MQHVTLAMAMAAKGDALAWFEAFAEVVGVGVTRIAGDYGVKVNLRDPLPAEMEVPSHIEGVPIRVEVTGMPRAQI
jgi:hypothetical protein